jgi:hypothetical protein
MVHIMICAYQSPAGAIQVTIEELDDDGAGTGYRLAGPKLAGTSKVLASYELTTQDADQIRAYLDRIGA